MEQEQQATDTQEESLEAVAAKVFGEPAAELSADAAEGEKAEGDKPAEKTEKPAEPSVSKKILAAKRIEMRFAEERRKVAAEKAAVEAERKAIEEAKKERDALVAAKKSPSELLKLSGLDPKTFLEQLADENEPAAVAKRVASEGLSEVEKLRAELAAVRQSIEDEKRKAQSQTLDVQVRAAQEQFLGHVETNATKYPHLTEEFTPDEIASQALAIAEKHSHDYHAKFGVYPDDEVIAEFLEAQAKARAEARGAWRERIGQRAQPRQGATPDSTKQPRTDSRGDGPRTLTSRATSERASAKRGWSQEDADEESLRILSAALR